MLNIAIIGCGVISKRHAELLGGNRIEGARLAAVCDTDKQKAELLGSKFGVPAYFTMDNLIQEASVDVLVILTPSGLHARHVCQMAKYGKHIIVEKPMALNIDDANEMIETCRDNNIGLYVIKQNRFNTPVKKTKEALDQGRFGNLFMGTVRIRWSRGQSYYDKDAWRGTWDLDGGILANQASHHLDLLLWMMGDVKSVFAKSINAIANIDTEDTAVVLVKFKNGALGLIEATTATRPRDLEGSLSILGDKASVVIGGFSANKLEVWNFSEEQESDKLMLEEYSQNPNIDHYAHQLFYEDIVSAINGDSEALIDGFEGKKSVELIEAIYKSINLKEEIYL